jgi:hypothetical protein
MVYKVVHLKFYTGNIHTFSTDGESRALTEQNLARIVNCEDTFAFRAAEAAGVDSF